MSAPIPSLWKLPPVDVLSPIAILRQQAVYLADATKRVLEADVGIADTNNTWLWIKFEIVANQLDRHRVELFRVCHRIDSPYPVTITCPGLIGDVRGAGHQELLQSREPEYEYDDEFDVVATTQDDLIDVLRIILGGKRASGIMQSLIARTNETLHNRPLGE